MVSSRTPRGVCGHQYPSQLRVVIGFSLWGPDHTVRYAKRTYTSGTSNPVVRQYEIRPNGIPAFVNKPTVENDKRTVAIHLPSAHVRRKRGPCEIVSW